MSELRRRMKFMNNSSEFLAEIEHEAASTGRLLERIPAGRLDWRPHPKSMSLGQLGMHVATIPSRYAEIIANDAIEVADLVNHVGCDSLEELRQAWALNLASVREQIRQAAVAPDSNWSVARDGKPLLTLPKATARRLLMLNHWYHHRGQLTVYLRLLDIPVPSVYGPSADENPFA